MVVSYRNISIKLYVEMITRCPRNTDRWLASQCANVSESSGLFSKVPVLDNFTGLNYRNVYCAKCHKINYNHWRMWDFKLPTDCCNNKTENCNVASDTFESINCEVYFFWNNYTRCSYMIQKAIDKCHSPNHILNKKCKTSAMSIVGVPDYQKIYRNEFCAQCNNVSTFTFAFCAPLTSPPFSFGKPLTLSKIFDFTSAAISKLSSTDINAELLAQNDSVNSTHNPIPSQHHSLVAFYLGLVCVAISAIMILFLNVCVLVNNELRNKSMQSLQLLAIYILLNNLFYVIIALHFYFQYSNWFCKTIAILFYYFNMSTFTCSVAIGLNIFLMMYGKSSCISFYQLTGAVMAISILLTTVSVSVDVGAPRWSFSPHFGMSSCWINSVNGHILFYYSPAAASIILNIGNVECELGLDGIKQGFPTFFTVDPG